MRTMFTTTLNVAAAILALLCAMPTDLRATTIIVTSTNDSGSGTLRDALAAAANGDTIDATGLSGIITLTSGQLSVSKGVTILGPGAGMLTVSGNYVSRVFNVTGTNVTICRLTIANGRGADNGMGLYASGGTGSINISDCVVTNNNSLTYSGGGICNGLGVTMTVSNCAICGNSAQQGGGICNNGYLGSATMTLNNCTITNNTATIGGGIYNDGWHGSATMTISNCRISGHSVGKGGGIYNEGGYGTGVVTIGGCTISGNHASDSGGGVFSSGWYSGSTARVTINTSTLCGNSADSYGGGIMNEGTFAGSTVLTINASTFSGNSALDGGAIKNNGINGTMALTINASTFSGNSASAYQAAGAILHNGGTLEIGDTILNSGGGSGANIRRDAGTVTSDGYNLCNDSGGGFLNKTGDQTYTDPMLGPLQDSGGPTWTHALLPGSPAVDKGKRDAVTSLASTTDQRGLTRQVDFFTVPNASGGDGSDIGAFEIQKTQPPGVASTADSGVGTLREALASAVDGNVIDATSLAGTITLTNGQLSVSKSVTLLGPGSATLTVSGNHASRVFYVTGTNVTIRGLTIANGQSTDSNGGGILAFGGTGSTIALTSCIVSSNSTSWWGGGISTSGGVMMTISNCTICGNYGGSGGGAIQNDHGVMAVVASTIRGNSTDTFGGGIYNSGRYTGNAILTVNASTISGNVANRGGGIYNDGGYANGTLAINASTLSDNWAYNGGGIYNDNWSGTGTVVIGDTILNAGAQGENIENYSGPILSAGYNLCSDNGSGFLTGVGDQTNTAPNLGPLQNNGGTTWTHALLAGSPAIDKGKRDAIAGLGLSTDQRGLPRPADFASVPNATGGDGSDIGAFEVQTRIIMTSTNDSGPGTLRDALASAIDGNLIDATGLSGLVTLTNGQLTVSNSVTILGPGPGALTVSGNHASRVFNVTGTNVTLSGLTIANGQGALYGAGISASGRPGSTVTISNCVIANNSTSLSGGGLFNNPGVTMTVSGCTVSGNYASANGGGIYNNNSTMTIVASTLSGNSTYLVGGGIMNDGQSGSAALTISACTVSSNSAWSGGGILNYGQSCSATLTIHASTFNGNSAGYAGDTIQNTGWSGTAAVEIGDTILNGGTSGRNIYNDVGTVTSRGYNLSGDGGSGFLTATNDQINADPKLGPLQDNGGPTFTHALLARSPAIDKGKRDAIPALARTTDQRGLARPVDNPYLANATGGDGSDIGAFEVQGSGGNDTDADGLPDFWELAWFGNLSQSGTNVCDGTGQNNLFKYVAGLDPTDPASVFAVRVEKVAGQPNQRNLIFKPWAAGRTYTPQFTTNLATTAFGPLIGYSTTTNGTEVIVTDPNATGQQRFYRILISLP